MKYFEMAQHSAKSKIDQNKMTNIPNRPLAVISHVTQKVQYYMAKTPNVHVTPKQ